MILAKSAIRQAVFDGRIKILDDEGAPFPGWEFAPYVFSLHDGPLMPRFTQGDPEALQPASIDLSLGRHWMVPKPNRDINGLMVMDSRLPVEYDECFVDEIIVPAKGFILARTREQVFVDKSISAWVEGRSSFGRFGTFVQNAGWVDPGFQGTITLEIFNALDVPAILYAGTPCCQLVIPEVTGDTEDGYTGQYQGQIATKGSGLWKSVPKGAL
jgi:dCTP deaminase